MKLLKKVLAVTAALTLTFAAVPASAATDVIDFEDGNVPSTITMKTDDGGDVSLLSVADFNGSKQLFVDIQDATLVPKILFDIPTLVGVDNLENVRTFSFDVTVVNPAGEPAGWNGGGDGANIGADGSTWYGNPVQWQLEEYENADATFAYSMSFVDGMGFTNGVAESSYLFMKWAGANDIYIDNIKFLDADGNAVALAGAADDTAEVAATDDTAAADTATDAPKTGVISLGVVYGLGAIATGAVALKRKQK